MTLLHILLFTLYLFYQKIQIITKNKAVTQKQSMVKYDKVYNNVSDTRAV